MLGERALDGDGAVEALLRGLEGDHEAVAHGLHFVAVVGLELLADEGVVLAQELLPRLVAEALGEHGRVFDVAEHDRDGAVGRGVDA